MQSTDHNSKEYKNLSVLRNIYFFHSLPDSALLKIRNLCTERVYEPDTVLFFEGVPGDSFFVILEGELEIWKRYGQSDEMLLGLAIAGQPLGEMALIDKQPRSATVKAKTRVRSYVLEASDFDLLLSSENSICMSLLRSVTMMVRRSNDAHVSDLDAQNKKLAQAYAELQAAQEELVRRERLSVVGRFSSLILHDLRNPLSALKSRIELLGMNRDDASYFDDAIKKINNDISRMENLSAEFLDYARGEIRLQMSVCTVSVLLERLVEAMSEKTSRGGIHLRVESAVLRPVILDQERILRMLINACENACKAMYPGGSLSVSVSEAESHVVFEVRDTGVGMSPDVLAHVFEPFYSVSSAGGTGLGMMIIKSIVDAHHGSVSLESEEGKGTILRARIPALG